MSESAWWEGNLIDGIRKRPGMFIGDLGFFGFVHYLVSATSMLMVRGPRQIRVAVDGEGFTVTSDSAVPIEEGPGGLLRPFEALPEGMPGWAGEGAILAALSERLSVKVRRGNRVDLLEYECGLREQDRGEQTEEPGDRTVLQFFPDRSIFSVTDLDPMVFAYHSTTEPVLWCFLNKGRAAEGGTHEAGLQDGIKHLTRILGSRRTQGQVYDPRISNPEAMSPIGNGVLGVVSLHDPGATWEGCIKGRAGNPELKRMVHDLFVRHSLDWLASHPEAERRLRSIRTFHFPEIWNR